ncbi:MAG TPA: DUF559 domain-containing protein [Bacteroidales bacterium]|mgnify:CR=1 FL=1|nr:DUF559 domain-containing protein [Bacteroidales bacterium]HPS73616.1 DUF559 domain-containing protein [Bacteroidales bacterium]
MFETNPIQIELIKDHKYKLTIKLDNWELTRIVTETTLNELQNEINNATGLTKVTDTFNCTGEEARKIKHFWETIDYKHICKECKFKWIECYNCAIKCDSPLERDLLFELRKNNIEPILQRRFNKDGSFYEFPTSIDPDTILTIPDFYIEKEKIKLCIYADGHNYHERTENQALRDRNIDRELQRMGYKVLRYTGQEIRKNCSLVVENIKVNLEL